MGNVQHTSLSESQDVPPVVCFLIPTLCLLGNVYRPIQRGVAMKHIDQMPVLRGRWGREMCSNVPVVLAATKRRHCQAR